MPAPSQTEALWEQLRQACAGLPAVSERRMFGCHTVFAASKVFALVWPEGRLGVKLPEPALHAALLAQAGAAPWRVKGRTMSTWVLLPEAFHADPARLGEWVAHAHRLALAADQAPRPARRRRLPRRPK
ncbi:MAG: TfoX/Sxy family protein [Anaerolineales bacterium]|nr:TfoX/Sxy family protein [Anaerolineales bacterium]